MKRQAFTVVLCWSIFAVGTALGAAAQTTDAAPTFTKDIAPLLYRSCVTCHRSHAPQVRITLDQRDLRSVTESTTPARRQRQQER